MKFCTKCGAELFDEAVICVKCGRMVERPAPETTPSTPKDPPSAAIERKPSLILVISNFAHFIATSLLVLFLILSVGMSGVYSSAYTKPKYRYVTSAGTILDSITVDVYSYLHPAYELLILAFIFGVISFLFGIVSFVMTLAERHKGERLLSGIGRLILSIAYLVGAIVLFAC